MAQLIKENKDVRFIYRHFPLISIHDKAALATQASEAAGLQGKFWEMHDVLMEKQQEWSGMSVDDFKAWLIKASSGLGLDEKKFTEDLTSEKIANIAQKAYEDAANLGIPGTPALAINGIYYNGDISVDGLTSYIKKLGNVKSFDCPAMTIDPKKTYKATLKTQKGDIVIQLFADKAPVTVNSFVFLTKEGFYNGVTFHRVITDFVAQTGDPFGTGVGGPGYRIKNEIDPSLTFGEEGVVGMANSGADTNGSQFFITYKGIPADVVKKMDGNYTIFGKVESGMDVVKKLTPRDPQQNPNAPAGDAIESIEITEQ